MFRNFACLLLLLAGVATFAGAQVPVGHHSYDWAAVSATGATPYIDLRASANSGQEFMSAIHTVSVSLGAGTNTVCTYQIEASDDTVNWFSLSGAQSCTASAMFSVTDRPARMVRINVLTYTGSASLTFHWTGR